MAKFINSNVVFFSLMTLKISISRHLFSSLIDSYRCSSSSTQTESGFSRSITAFTCSALCFDTWAVPINIISFPLTCNRVMFSSDIRFSSFTGSSNVRFVHYT